MFKNMNDKSFDQIFLNAMSSYDNSYQKFSSVNKPIYKELYVESQDDVLFYSNFLTDHYTFHVCNNKDEVLREARKYNGKKAGFIVDLDYLPFDQTQYDNLIVTTGYSMENFYFYKEGKKINLENVFKHYYKNYEVALYNYKNALENFKKQYLEYYALFKTCMEFKTCKGFDKKVCYTDIFDSCEDVNSLIEKEIQALNKSTQEKFKMKFHENIILIEKNGYMLLRGHDIFNHLIALLNKDKNIVHFSELMKLARNLEMPSHFEKQINR